MGIKKSGTKWVLYIFAGLLLFSACKPNCPRDFNIEIQSSETPFYKATNETFQVFREYGHSLIVDLALIRGDDSPKNDLLCLYIDSCRNIFPYSSSFESDAVTLSEYLYEYVISSGVSDLTVEKSVVLIYPNERVLPLVEKISFVLSRVQNDLFENESMRLFNVHYEDLSLENWKRIEDKFRIYTIYHPPLDEYLNTFPMLNSVWRDTVIPTDFSNFIKVEIFPENLCIIDDCIETVPDSVSTYIEQSIEKFSCDTVQIIIQPILGLKFVDYARILKQINSDCRDSKVIKITENNPKLSYR